MLQVIEPTLAYVSVAFVVELVFFVLLLLGSAFVSGSEVALYSLDDGDIHALKAEDSRAARRIVFLLDRPDRLLVTILVLNNVLNVAAVTLAAVMTLELAATFQSSKTILIIAEVVVVTFVLLIVGEMTPKLTAVNHAVKYSRIAAAPLTVFFKLLLPFSTVISRFMKGIQSRIKLEETLSSDDVKRIAEFGEAQGGLAEDERQLIESIVELGNAAVREIMVSRMDIVAVPDTASYTEVLEVIRSSGHSRVPMFRDDLDNIEGVIYAKDLIPFLGDSDREEGFDWQPIVRRPLFVPMSKKLDELLRDFQSKRTHVAIVVDEYGGTAGLVTLEDVLEEIVGDIKDEYDLHERPLWRKVGPKVLVVDAKLDLDDLNDLMAEHLDATEDQLIQTSGFDFETIGGLIFHLTESIPSEGQEVRYRDFTFTVETVENHRIGRVRARLGP
jgi:gliding motility-associated protein GldE